MVTKTELASTPAERAKRVIAVREALDLTRPAFAQKMSIPHGTIQNWEEIRFGGLSERGAKRLANALSYLLWEINMVMNDSLQAFQQKILLVEDDPIIQKVHSAFIQKIGISTDIAGTGQQALDMYHKGRYPLIILDGGLPDVDGFEVGRGIRECEKVAGKAPMPLLLLSGYRYEDVRYECEIAGINEFAIKPIQPSELQAMILRWLPVRTLSA